MHALLLHNYYKLSRIFSCILLICNHNFSPAVWNKWAWVNFFQRPQTHGLNVVKGLRFPLLCFSTLIILFQENILLRCKRSCLRLVKKLTGEFMRVNELYFLIEYKILWGICLLTSWACTIGIWSKLMQLNLIRQIY